MPSPFAFPLLLSAALLAPQAPTPKAAGAKGAEEASTGIGTVQRIAVLGASLSDGVGLDADVGAPVTLSSIVEASLLAGHEPIFHKASLLLFANPVQIARENVAEAKAKDPTLVVGLDFLFWFGYGAVPSDAERLVLLEKGLALLAEFSCPVLVGDFADVSDAVAGSTPETKGLLLAPEQVPSPDALKKLNERLRAWAADHPNVIVVPLADLLARVRADEEITIRGNRWFKGSLKGLLQKDRLHPTLEGAIALWLAGLDQLVAAREDLPGNAFDWDWKSIYRKVYASREKERQARFEKEKKKAPKLAPEPPQPPGGGKGRAPNRLGEGSIDRDN